MGNQLHHVRGHFTIDLDQRRVTSPHLAEPVPLVYQHVRVLTALRLLSGGGPTRSAKVVSALNTGRRLEPYKPDTVKKWVHRCNRSFDRRFGAWGVNGVIARTGRTNNTAWQLQDVVWDQGLDPLPVAEIGGDVEVQVIAAPKQTYRIRLHRAGKVGHLLDAIAQFPGALAGCWLAKLGDHVRDGDMALGLSFAGTLLDPGRSFAAQGVDHLSWLTLSAESPFAYDDDGRVARRGVDDLSDAVFLHLLMAAIDARDAERPC
jgi:hypothetical protein